MTRIWFNHWFSSSYNIINLIKKDIPGVRVIGTNKNRESPIQMACDEWYQEPELQGEEYIDFCLGFCREHQVDVFIPRREIVSISKNKARFAALDVKVMADDFQVISLMNEKDRAYAAFQAAGIENIPEHYVVRDSGAFRAAYDKLAEKYEKICFKFARDEGGTTFRRIDNRLVGFSSLLKKQATRMSIDTAVTLLSQREVFAPLIIMPYLPNEEVSVDCLMTAQGLIAIPRVKGPTRVESVRYDPQILNACQQIFERFPLEHPCNIQFKYSEGTPYLLEVNTRMSGGIQMSCAVSGVNIPAIAVGKMIGVDIPWSNGREEKKVSYVERPIVL